MNCGNRQLTPGAAMPHTKTQVRHSVQANWSMTALLSTK
jgi:hypothetical protein